MENFTELEAVGGGDVGGRRRGAVDDPEAPEGGDGVPYLAGGVAEAVGEAEEEAGEAAEGDEAGGHGAVGVVALPLVGEHRRQDLERQHGARRQVLREIRRALQRQPDRRLPAARLFAVGGRRRWRPVYERLLLLIDDGLRLRRRFYVCYVGGHFGYLLSESDWICYVLVCLVELNRRIGGN